MANTIDYSDLAEPNPNTALVDYSDLAQPSSSNMSEKGSLLLKNILNTAKGFLPKPQLPLGMNVASGLMGAMAPQNEKNLINQLPQIASGQNYGMPQMAASGLGQTIPGMMSGGGILPQAVSGGLQGFVNAPPGEGLKSGVENALINTGISKGLPYIGNLFKSADSEKIAPAIQAAHDALSNKAAQGFEDVSQGVNARGINQVPVSLSMMSNLPKYFPNTLRNKQLINDALSGDYNALRNLQSDLWTRGTKSLSSNLAADRNMGEEMLDMRDKVNDAISKHLINTGNDDLNNILNGSRADYATLKDVYYNKKLPRAIPKLVNPETREMPNNLMDILQKSSVPMNKLRNHLMTGSFAPEQNAILNIPGAVNAMNARKNLYSLGKGLGIGGGIAGGLGAGYHYLWPQKQMSVNPIQNP